MEPVSHSAADLLPIPALHLDSLDGMQPDPVTQISPVVPRDRPSNPRIAMDVYPTPNGVRGDVTTKTGDLPVRLRSTGADPSGTPSVTINGNINNIVGNDGRGVVGVEFLPNQVRPRIGGGWGGVVVSHEQRIPFSGGPSTGVTSVRVPLGSGLSGAVTYVDPPGPGKEEVNVEVALKGKDTQITGVYTAQSSGLLRGGVVFQQKIGPNDRFIAGEVSHGRHRDTVQNETQVRVFVNSRF